MAEGEQQRGLSIPKHVSRHLEITGAEGQVSPIRWHDNQDLPKAGQALLLEMLEEIRRIEDVGDSASKRYKETKLCATLIEHLLALSETSISDANSMAALLLGYLYRGLSLPSEKRYEAVSQETFRFLYAEYSRGNSNLKKAQQQGRDWMKRKAAEIWEQDHTQQFRIADVASKVQSMAKQEAERRKKLGDTKPLTCWGTNLATIRRNIKQVAPAYAKQAGRPRKT
ncbi:hypothetical protein ACPF7Z_11075 [Halomonas sp. GXIMD04776]|uniref:hypothetical protein n=1 Tax=Halomonas sp. GXIMD04776 TaxID=3415605 RepID=UPI003CC470C2